MLKASIKTNRPLYLPGTMYFFSTLQLNFSEQLDINT